MKEALKLALEALHYCEALNRPVHEQKIHAIKAIKEALAQPEMRPDEISTDELIYMNGLHDGMKQERALWELSKLGQEIEAQPEHGWTSERIAGVERLKAQQDSRFEPEERPWKKITDEERARFETLLPKTQEEWDDLFNGIEAKLKEKNFD